MPGNTALSMFFIAVVVAVVSALMIAVLCIIEWPGANSPEYWSLTDNEEEDGDDEST